MEDRKLTGNDMFEMVKEECERILGKVGINRKKKQKKVLFYSDVNGNYEWVEGGDDTKEFKYEGEVEKGKPNGEGNLTYRGIFLYGGEWKDGERWKGTEYFGYENIYDFYSGEYKENECHGQGTLKFNDGRKYEGEVKRGGILEREIL